MLFALPAAQVLARFEGAEILTCQTYYHMNRNIDSDFNLAFGDHLKIAKLTLICHYQSIYTTSIGFSPYSTEICQFKIPPTVSSEQTAKHNVRLYFCLYQVWLIQ